MSRDGQHKQEARTRLYTAIDASKRPQYISHVEGGKGGAGMAGYWALEAAACLRHVAPNDDNRCSSNSMLR